MTDAFGRVIDYLRLSVTERCDLNCLYCGPGACCESGPAACCAAGELVSMAAACVALGVKKIRLTGGEPLLRRDILELIAALRALPGLEELSMTTNGQRLPELAAPLRAAGLDRLNVSLDSLRPERYRALTRGGSLERVLKGLAAAEASGFRDLRLNVVLLRGFNDDELAELAGLAREHPWSVRFIELMPIGAGAELDAFLPAEQVLRALPELRAWGQADAASVARLYSAPGWAGTVGLIAPVSRPFCAGCNRLRITADGRLKPCLHAPEEYALRGLSGEALRAAILAAVAQKPARHRLAELGHSESARPMQRIGG